MSELVHVVCVSNRQYVAWSDQPDEGLTDSGLLNLTVGRTYRARREGAWWRVWDDYDEDYLYPPDMFVEV